MSHVIRQYGFPKLVRNQSLIHHGRIRILKTADKFSYDSSDLHGNIPVRVSKYAIKEDIGTIKCQEDWSKYVTDLKGYKGGLAGSVQLHAITVPECLPNRLESISYANELAFLYDDATENISQDELEKTNDKAQHAFDEGVRSGSIADRAYGIRAVQAALFADMRAIDEPRAVEAIRAWSQFLADAAGRQHHETFDSLDKYNAYRLMDAGEMYWYGVVTFGMGITIPEEEPVVCRELAKEAYIVLGLQNDLYSWPKELQAATDAGEENVVNAVYVLMNVHQCNEQKAMKLCREHIKDHVRKYEDTVAQKRNDTSLSLDLRRYLDALLYSISGNGLWSAICPRYYSHRAFTPLQASMIQHGWKRALEMAGFDEKGDKRIGADHDASSSKPEIVDAQSVSV